MSANDDPYTDDADDDDPYDDSFFPGRWRIGWGFGLGWLPLSRREADDETAYRNEPDGEDIVTNERDEHGSWWDEGLISLLLIVGVVLFFFPEPATSMLGIILILIGAVAWLIDALT